MGASLEGEAEEGLWETRAPGRQAGAGDAGKGLGVVLACLTRSVQKEAWLARILAGPQISVQEGVPWG